MKIEGNTVIFKTAPEFFEKERNGTKPNTVRTLSQSEDDQLFNAKPKYIKIISTETSDSFTRQISDISPAYLSEGCRVFVISWISEGQNKKGGK